MSLLLTNIFDCRSKLAEKEMNQYSLIPSALVVLVLFAFQFYKERKITITPPFETLISITANQKLTIFGFGTMANAIIRLIVNSSQSLQNGTWLEVTQNLGLFVLNFLIIAAINYPTFLCILSPYKFIAAVLGVLLMLQKMAFFFLSITNLNCQVDVNQGVAIGVQFLQYLPTIICFLVVLYKFIRQFVEHLKLKQFGKIDNTGCSLANKGHVQHLKEVLRKDKLPILPPVKIGWYQKPYRKFSNVYHSSVQYSNIFSCSIAVIVIAYYYFLVGFSYIGATKVEQIGKYLANIFQGSNKTTSNGIVVIGESIINSYFIAMLLTFVFYAWLLLDLLQSHQNNLRRIFSGKHKTEIEAHLSAQDLTLYNIIFPGYFISYMIWGVVVFFAVSFFLVLVLYLFILVLTYFPDYVDIIVSILKYMYLLLTLPLLAYILQYLLVIFFFTDRKTKKLTMLRSINMYHFVMYVFFFYNLVVGIVSCIKRSITGLFISLMVLGRIDQTPFAFLKHYDTGYCAYHGFLRLQGMYKNPVMRCFIQMLNESVNADNLMKTINGEFPTMLHSDVEGLNNHQRIFPQSSQPTISRKVRNRWFLAYTLLRNPTLVHERHHLESKKERDILLAFEGAHVEHDMQTTHDEEDNYDGGPVEYSGKDLFLI